MRFWTDVNEWCVGAAEVLGDPSKAVCQLFLRWRDDLDAVIAHKACADDIACGMVDVQLVFWLGPHLPVLPVPAVSGEPQIENDGIIAYGFEKIDAGVWAMEPSLNVEGMIHGFVVLYRVPDPAPWERRIVLP